MRNVPAYTAMKSEYSAFISRFLGFINLFEFTVILPKIYGSEDEAVLRSDQAINQQVLLTTSVLVNRWRFRVRVHPTNWDQPQRRDREETFSLSPRS